MNHVVLLPVSKENFLVTVPPMPTNEFFYHNWLCHTPFDSELFLTTSSNQYDYEFPFNWTMFLPTDTELSPITRDKLVLEEPVIHDHGQEIDTPADYEQGEVNYEDEGVTVLDVWSIDVFQAVKYFMRAIRGETVQVSEFVVIYDQCDLQTHEIFQLGARHMVEYHAKLDFNGLVVIYAYSNDPKPEFKFESIML